MSNEVIISIISGLCVAIPTIYTTLASNSKNNALQDERIGNLQKQISDLSNRVDKLKNFELELAKLSTRIELLEKSK